MILTLHLGRSFIFRKSSSSLLLAFLGELPVCAPYARQAKRSSEIIGVGGVASEGVLASAR